MVATPRCKAKTWGRSMEVSVIPTRRWVRLRTSDWAMRKNQGPSGELLRWTVWSMEYRRCFAGASSVKSRSVVGAIASMTYSSG